MSYYHNPLSQNYKKLLDHIPDAFFHGDRNGNFIYVNHAAEELTGYSKEELLTMSMQDLFSKDTLETEPLRYDKLQTGNNLIKIRKLRKKDGSEIHIEMHSRINDDGTYQSIFRDIEPRLSMENALKKSRQIYKDLFEKSKDAILIIENGIFVDCNQATVQMLVYNTKSELLATHPSELSPPIQPDGKPSFEKANEMMEIAIKKGYHRFEWDHLRADGSVFPVEVSLTLLAQEKDKTILHTVWRDITLRKKDELIKSALYQFTGKALVAESVNDIYETFFESIIQLLPIQLFYVCQLPGEGNNLITLFSKSLIPELTFNINYENSLEHIILNSKEPMYLDQLEFSNQLVEHHLLNPYSQTPILWIGIPISLPENQEGMLVFAGFSDVSKKFPIELEIIESFVNQLIISLNNITRREYLFQSELKYRTIFEESPIGIFHFDKNGIITDCNKKFVDIIGSTAQQLIGFNMLEKLKNETLRVEIKRSLKEGTAYFEDYYESVTAVKKSYVRIFLKGIEDSSGNIVSGIGLVEDYTETKKLEEQLFQSQKMEAIGKLAGGVAHDFNNLLTVINGYADMLIRDPNLNDSNRKKITQISEAGEKAASLTMQLLAFARKQFLQPALINLNELIVNLSDMLQRLIGDDIVFSTNLIREKCIIFADPVQVEQIIINLAANARDAMPGGGTFKISTETVSIPTEHRTSRKDLPAGSYVLLKIKDSGTGIENQILQHIFEPFFTTKDQGKGTGLGLATVYGIVKQSKGHIEVESTVGEGTSFHIYFPLKQSKSPAGEKSEVQSAILTGKELILVVEDENSVRNLVVSALHEFGYTAWSASNGHEALKILEEEKEKPDLLLTDITMPDMSGKELAVRIKKHLPDIKICYMSGYSDSILTQKNIKDTNSIFIQKPFSIPTFLNTIRKALDQ